MKLLKRKHRHDWEQYPHYYTPTMTRRCNTCGEFQVWHEVHYGTWEAKPPPEKSRGNNED